ncbi:MAG: hypothetical protein L6422_05865, partial [Candidatus Marinimicrobia bacterium]|nr:hypothetical protein [Candidatus Neomarinimicrobiota bacterium]
MRGIAYCIITIILMISVLQSQEDVEDMMRKLQEATQEKINQSEQAVQDFIARDDAEFAKFLEEDWRMFQAFQGMVRDKKPKPVDVPVAKIKKPVVFKGKEVEPIQIPDKPKQKPILVEKTVPGIPIERGKILNVKFFNVDLEIVYDERFKSPINIKVDNRSISKFWEILSRSDFDNFIKQAKYYKQNMNLNDWGYALLVHRIGKILYSRSQNEANLFTWFMLSKSGYNVKIGFNDTDVFLLLPTENMLYSTSYLTLDNQRYFIVSFDETSRNIGKIFTYEGEYPGSNKLLSFNIVVSPVFRNEVINKNLSFKYKNKTYTIPVKFNLDAVNFFEHYPQTNFEVYFNSTMLP